MRSALKLSRPLVPPPSPRALTSLSVTCMIWGQSEQERLHSQHMYFLQAGRESCQHPERSQTLHEENPANGISLCDHSRPSWRVGQHCWAASEERWPVLRCIIELVFVHLCVRLSRMMKWMRRQSTPGALSSSVCTVLVLAIPSQLEIPRISPS